MQVRGARYALAQSVRNRRWITDDPLFLHELDVARLLLDRQTTRRWTLNRQ